MHSPKHSNSGPTRGNGSLDLTANAAVAAANLIPQLRSYAMTIPDSQDSRLEKLVSLTRTLAYCGRIDEAIDSYRAIEAIEPASLRAGKTSLASDKAHLMGAMAASALAIGQSVRGQELLAQAIEAAEKLPAPQTAPPQVDGPRNDYISALGELAKNLLALGQTTEAQRIDEKIQAAYPLQLFGTEPFIADRGLERNTGVKSLIVQKQYDLAVRYLTNLEETKSAAAKSLASDYLEIYKAASRDGASAMALLTMSRSRLHSMRIKNPATRARAMLSLSEAAIQSGDPEAAAGDAARGISDTNQYPSRNRDIENFAGIICAAALLRGKGGEINDALAEARSFLQDDHLPYIVDAASFGASALRRAGDLLSSMGRTDLAMDAFRASAQLFSSPAARKSPFFMGGVPLADFGLASISTREDVLREDLHWAVALSKQIKDPEAIRDHAFKLVAQLSRSEDETQKAAANYLLDDLDASPAILQSKTGDPRSELRKLSSDRREEILYELDEIVDRTLLYIEAAQNCRREDLICRGLSQLSDSVDLYHEIALSPKSPLAASIYARIIRWAGENGYGELLERTAAKALITFDAEWFVPAEIIDRPKMGRRDEQGQFQVMNTARRLIFGETRQAVGKVLSQEPPIAYFDDEFGFKESFRRSVL